MVMSLGVDVPVFLHPGDVTSFFIHLVFYVLSLATQYIIHSQQVITKLDDRTAGARFVYHEYDYRQNWTTRSLITN